MTFPITLTQSKIICDAYFYMLDMMDFTQGMMNDLGYITLYLMKAPKEETIVLDINTQTLYILNDVLLEYYYDARGMILKKYNLEDMRVLNKYIEYILEGEIESW